MNRYLSLLHYNRWWIHLGLVFALLTLPVPPDMSIWLKLIGAIVVFCLAETACYILHDLVYEKNPWIASGEITSGTVINILRIMIVLSFGLAFFISKTLLLLLIGYILLTCLYLFAPFKARLIPLVYGFGLGSIYYFAAHALQG